MNGWTNRDTWNTHLHLANSSYRIQKTSKLCSNPEEIEALFGREFGDGHDGIRMDEVNWAEILTNLRDSP